ncbi:large conductance mechanosensitive channel protein MscL [Candidatus Woesearchaeota archaeon CG10_big_fil_rev_8_21_14_0_10_45_16]|nr:MAG: large conductance mechanosensitive channel protein MscL [Candidatus Woesearchaeota archaeon CG10_big_fil_rev_8_21_14_0_10_45_16]
MVFKGFKIFLKEYRIIAVSVAFIVSLASLSFIQSFVNDILLPILRPFVSNSATWEEMILPIGSVNLRVGSFLSSFLSLLIILILLYVVVARILRWKPKK